MRYLTLAEVLELQQSLIDGTGGASGIRDLGALASAVAQPEMAFEGADLYATLPEKAAALAFSLIQNHPFIDGNKRIGHAALEVFLLLNDHELDATVDDAERVILGVASGRIPRPELFEWVRAHSVELESSDG